VSNEWLASAHGIYYARESYDEGPDGDNWTYIDPKTLCIVDYRPEKVGPDKVGVPLDRGHHLAGPFPTLDAAKAAYIVMFGRYVHAS